MAPLGWLLVAPLYAVAVALGVGFYFDPEQIATFWPASGIFMGLLVLCPVRQWPGIVLLASLGQLGADSLIAQRPVAMNVALALPNTLEPILGALLVRRFLGTPDFARLRHVAGIAGLAVLAPLPTALSGAAVVSYRFGTDYVSALQIWWAADALGILAVLPVVVLNHDWLSVRSWRKPSWQSLAIVGLCMTVASFVFAGAPRPAASLLDFSYVLMPPLIVAALRLSPRALAWLLLATCAVVVVTLFGCQVVCAAVQERAAGERQRSALEDRLRQSEKMEAIGRLAGGIAHDFNNLLMVIQGNQEMVREELEAGRTTAPGLLEWLRQSNAATDRAARLTRQLLMFSRKHPEHRQPIDLNDVVTGLEPMLRRIIGAHVQIHVRTAAHLPPILADRGQIEQVVMNLAINARDAMPTGGRLEIETSASKDVVQLRVADSGQGIAADVLPHVFEPFFTTKRAGEGTGLGLATVHAIVTQNEGLIDIRSSEREGTEVTVSLPAMTTPAAPITRAQSPTQAVGGHERILVCEDEPGLWQVLERSLLEAGYDVLLAPDVSAALNIAGAQERLDVLITDVVMPGLSGPALASRVREIHPGLRVLFISGYPADMAPHTGSEFVASALLNKPFRAEELRVRVRALIDAQPSGVREGQGLT